MRFCTGITIFKKSAGMFLKQANNSILDDGHSFLRLQLDNKQKCADGGWLLRTWKNDEVFAIFLNGKSSHHHTAIEDASSNNNTARVQDMSSLPKNGSQAQHLLNLAEACKTMENITKNSLAEALSKGNFLYIYVNTDTKRCSFSVGSNILHMGGADSHRFLSFFSEYFVLHNKLSSKAADSSQEGSVVVIESQHNSERQ
jgi:hypothetical protein